MSQRLTQAERRNTDPSQELEEACQRLIVKREGGYPTERTYFEIKDALRRCRQAREAQA